MNSNWYKGYLVETRRRQEQIKFAEEYRKAKHNPDEPPKPKAYQRLFSALGGILSRWGRRSQEQQPVSRRDYARERR